jgi:undecaprenyl-diphosphatase
MYLFPTPFDIWFTGLLARHLGQSRFFDLSIQGAIAHNLLGGLWYAAPLFIFWVWGAAPGGEATRRRVLTTLLGSLIAIVLMMVAESLIILPPPSRIPELSGLFPSYIRPNPDPSSFPSQSATLYAAVAAGVFSLHKITGWLLWVGVFLIVGIPRIYVGGHYPSDVVAGALLGLAGYALARFLLEQRVVARSETLFNGKGWLRVGGELFVFAWILQVSDEFRGVVWARGALHLLLLKIRH